MPSRPLYLPGAFFARVQVWLGRRTNFTRTLAVMSMAGYILGLGDRHPSNIMVWYCFNITLQSRQAVVQSFIFTPVTCLRSDLKVERTTGRVVHIDFGDCFEVAMDRAKCVAVSKGCCDSDLFKVVCSNPTALRPILC